ncbi:ABC transporter substrate-binding protein [Pseudactinotalea sp.]|uniref:ABC transporter substrate-binding protein n=1 Tax=Pseudactinotalea sp. TaxID=1926260 RepID=UPI003B3BE480
MTHTIPTRRSVLLGGAGLLSAGFLAACGSAPGGAGGAETSTTTPAGDPVAGGELSFAIGNDVGSLNPQGGGTGNDTLYVNRQVFDSLLYHDAESGELQPWLATEWTTNEDATEFSFTLRDDVTFSDGTPLTAQIVLDNFDDVLAQGANASNVVEYFADYLGGAATDEHTFTVSFGRPSAPFLQALSSVALSPLAPATLELEWAERLTSAIGTGPFVVESYTKDSEVVLVRRDDYAWGPSVVANSGAAYLEEVTFVILPEASVRTGAITSDQADAIGGVPPQDQASLTGAGLTIVERANPGVVFGITPFSGRPLLQDADVRRALSLAIDRTQVRDAAVNDSYAVATNVLASTTPGWSDLSEHIGDDAQQAADLLESAGWTLGEDGVRTKDGEPLRLTLWWVNNFVANQTTLELIQAQAKEIGIDIVLHESDWISLQEAQGNGEVDLSYGNLSRADPDILRTRFFFDDSTVNQPADGTLNELLERQRGLTGAERDAVVEEAAIRVLDEVYYIPVYELTTVLALEAAVQVLTLGADSRLDTLLGAWVVA